MSNQTFEIDVNGQFFNEPLLTTPFIPIDFKRQPWRDLNTPSAFVFVGNKRSGKDVAMDKELTICLENGFTVLSIFDGGGHEKLYCSISKNCKGKWKLVNKVLDVFEKKQQEFLKLDQLIRETEIEKELLQRLLGLMHSEKLVYTEKDTVQIIEKGFDELEGKLLHCNCHKGYPVTVIKPPYVKYSKQALDKFNGHYFEDFQEYAKAFTKGFVNEFLPVGTDYSTIKKPKSMIMKIKPKLKIIEAPVPRLTAKNIQEFLKIFTEQLLECRRERRILIACNPAFYPPDHEGKTDKYTTFSVIMDNLKAIADKHFIPLSLNKPRNEYTTNEKSHHKIALFVGEVRKPVPNSGMSPEREASISKRSFFAFMPESRHAKTFPRINTQSLADVLKGVNKQNDIIIVKKSSEGNLGDELGWLAKEMHNEIVKTLLKWRVWEVSDGKIIEKPINKMIKKRLIERAELCEISELPDNRAIVVNGNKQWKMTKYDAPSFHHKSDRDEFGNDSGIIFSFDNQITKRMAENSDKKSENASKSSKELRETMYEDALVEMKKDGMKYEQCYKNLLKKYENNSDMKNLLSKAKWKSFGENFKRWRLKNKK